MTGKKSMYELKIKEKIEQVTGLDDIKLTVPPPGFSGDLSSNAALASGIVPQKLAEELNGLDEVEKTDIAGPGFINITINGKALEDEIKEILSSPALYGGGEKKGKVLFEMVSSNPTGPLHIGHGRGAAIGDSLARIFEKLGYDVFREYYVNDTGNQMQLLGESVRCIQQGKEVPENGYRGDYMKQIAAGLTSSEDLSKAAGEKILGMHFETLNKFAVEYSSTVYESDFIRAKKVEDVIEEMKKRDLTYEKDGALWFRSSSFNDDADRVLIKKDGELTYFASDCAYHIDKAQRAERLVNIWGADHHGYVERLRAFFKAFGYAGKKRMDIVLYQLVDLKRGSEKVSMSTRAGEFVTLDEVLDEVGKDAARFFMLMRSSDAPLEFDLELAKEESSKNPVYYVQYSHARICSIFRKKGISFEDISPSDVQGLGNEEREIVKFLAHYPVLLQKCLQLDAPHLLTDYLRQSASAFHKYYDTVRVIGSKQERQRLALLRAVKEIIKDALGLLGVSAPEKM